MLVRGLLLLTIIVSAQCFADQAFVVEVPGYPPVTCRRSSAECALVPCSPVTLHGVSFSPMLRFGASGSTPFITFRSDSALGPLWSSINIRSSESGELVVNRASASNAPGKTGFAPLESIVGVNSLNAYNSAAFDSGRRVDAQTCQSSEVNAYIARERELIRETNQNIEQRGLAVLVEEVSGVLSGQLIPRFLLPPTACHRGDVYYGSAQAYQAQSQERFFDSHMPNPLSAERLSRLMSEINSRTDIPFTFVEDGCYARSHRIAHDLTTRGIYVEKVWAVGPGLGAPFGTPWAYHTAPVVYVTTPSGTVERRVIDPSVSREALSVDDWLSRISGRQNPQTVEVGWPPLRVPTTDALLVSYSPHYVYQMADSLNSVTGQQKRDRLEHADQENRQNSSR